MINDVTLRSAEHFENSSPVLRMTPGEFNEFVHFDALVSIRREQFRKIVGSKNDLMRIRLIQSSTKTEISRKDFRLHAGDTVDHDTALIIEEAASFFKSERDVYMVLGINVPPSGLEGYGKAKTSWAIVVNARYDAKALKTGKVSITPYFGEVNNGLSLGLSQPANQDAALLLLKTLRDGIRDIKMGYQFDFEHAREDLLQQGFQSTQPIHPLYQRYKKANPTQAPSLLPLAFSR